MKSYKQRASEFRKALFLQTVFESDKEFVKKCEHAYLEQVINELTDIKDNTEFRYVHTINNRKKKYKHRIIIDIKGK